MTLSWSATGLVVGGRVRMEHVGKHGGVHQTRARNHKTLHKQMHRSRRAFKQTLTVIIIILTRKTIITTLTVFLVQSTHPLHVPLPTHNRASRGTAKRRCINRTFTTVEEACRVVGFIEYQSLLYHYPTARSGQRRQSTT